MALPFLFVPPGFWGELKPMLQVSSEALAPLPFHLAVVIFDLIIPFRTSQLSLERSVGSY